jgi:vitamin B12 transporter
VEIPGVVVTATPVPLPVGALGSHVSVLDGEDLRARGITRVADALREAAGVTVVRGGSFGAVTSVFMRGGESDYVQVMVDGVAVNQPGGNVDLAGLTTEGVERIEIVRGPTSALHGSDAVAGVINIITRRGEGPTSGSLEVRGGSFGSLDGVARVQGGSETASYGVTLSRQATDGILAFNNDHENAVLTGSARLRLDPRTRADLTVRLQDRSYNFPTDGSGNVVDRNQSTFDQASTVGLTVARRVGDDLELRALLTLHDQETGTDDAPDGPADTLGFYGFQSVNSLRRSSADLRANWSAAEGLVVTAGAELEHQGLRTFSQSLSAFGPSTARSEEGRSNRAGYLHGVWSAGPVDANVGLRVEDNEQYGRFTSWQLGSAVRLAEGTRLRLAAGRGVKEPTFFEAFASGFARGNPDLDPETSSSWEVGLEQEVGSGVQLRATWFDQAFEDLIQFTSSPPDPDAPNFFNVAAADSRGLELSAQGGWRSLRAGATWTWLDTEVVDAGFAQGAGASFVEGEALLRRPENHLQAHLTGAAGDRVRWTTSLRWTGQRSDRDFTTFPAEPVTLDAFTVVDVGLQARVLEPEGGRPGVRLSLRGENLTDAGYQEVFGFPAPGRGLYVGLRLGWSETP